MLEFKKQIQNAVDQAYHKIVIFGVAQSFGFESNGYEIDFRDSRNIPKEFLTTILTANGAFDQIIELIEPMISSTSKEVKRIKDNFRKTIIVRSWEFREKRSIIIENLAKAHAESDFQKILERYKIMSTGIE